MSAISVVQGQQSVDQVRQARLGLIVYFSILIPISVLLYILINMRILKGVGLLMITPAISCVLARLILREGVKDVSFQLGGRRGIAASIFVVLLPSLLILLTYVPFWLFGWAQFNQKGLIFAGLSSQPVLDVALNILLGTLLGPIGLMFYALGEELGWRGFMLTRLISAKVPWPIFASGLIWGLWHVPLILGGQYDATSNPALGILTFMLVIMPFAYIVAWARLYSGSIWPAVLAHAAFNVVYTTFIGGAVKGGTYLIGETGLATGAIGIAVAIILYRYRPIKDSLLTPGQPMDSRLPARQIAPAYPVIGVLLIAGALVDLALMNYFVASACIFAGVGFLLYGLKREILWSQRPTWQRILLILLLTGAVLSVLAVIIQGILLSI